MIRLIEQTLIQTIINDFSMYDKILKNDLKKEIIANSESMGLKLSKKRINEIKKCLSKLYKIK